MSIKRINHAAGRVRPQKRVFTNAEIYAANNILAKSKKDLGGTTFALQQIGEIVRDITIRYAKKVTPIKEKI